MSTLSSIVPQATFEDLRNQLAGGDFRQAVVTACALLVHNTPEQAKPEREVKRRFASLAGYDVEHLGVIGLRDGKIVTEEIISKGIINRALLHPRELFASLLQSRADTLYFAHNHPSGLLRESPEDKQVTERVASVAHLLGLVLGGSFVVARSSSGIGLVNVIDGRVEEDLIAFGDVVLPGVTDSQGSSEMELLRRTAGLPARPIIEGPLDLLQFLETSSLPWDRASDYLVLRNGHGAAAAIRDIPAALPIQDKITYVAQTAIRERAVTCMYVSRAEEKSLQDAAYELTTSGMQAAMKAVGIELVESAAYHLEGGQLIFYAEKADEQYSRPLVQPLTEQPQSQIEFGF